jgi:signal transduction histidine kinase
VDPTKAIHVYRVLQEALSNVARHAGTDRAVVRLRFEPGRLELEVEDQGKGMDPDTARRGLGLVAMRERGAIVGGILEFSRPPQGGTRVRLSVPL